MADIGSSVIKLEGSGRVTLHAFGDIQFGSKSCDTYLLKHKIESIIRDPSGGMSVGLGDMADDDRPSTRDQRASAFASRPEVLDADARDHKFFIDAKVIPLLLPLAQTKHGIVGMLAGHHWKHVRVKDHSGVRYVNSARYICDELGRLTKRRVPYLGIMSSWIWLTFQVNKTKSVRQLVHIQHGEGGGQTLASALNKLEATSRWAEADLLIRAHDCKAVAGKLVRLGPRGFKGNVHIKSLKSKTVGILNIGSMTRGYVMEDTPDYVEMGMMRPTAMCWGKAHFDIRKASKTEDPNTNYTCELSLEI